MPREKTETVGITLRVREELRQSLEEAAKARKVSLNQEIVDRLEHVRGRLDLLPEVLGLAYGRETAGLLMMLGLAMAHAGEFFHVESGAAADGIGPWTDNPAAFANMTHTVVALLDAAKPEENSSQTPGRGLHCATELIRAIEDPNERTLFTAHSRATATIRALLGPIADRMIKAAETRPIVGLEPREQARQALVSDIANVLSALVVSKVHLHETGRADSPAPSREEVFEVLEKRFPIEEQAPAGPQRNDLQLNAPRGKAAEQAGDHVARGTRKKGSK
jgi:hypothetical protein